LVRSRRYSNDNDPGVSVYEVKRSPKNLEAISIADPTRRIETERIWRVQFSAIAASTNGASATAKTRRLKASKLDADAGVKLNSAPEPQNFNQ
jgi:hypothetical protein